MLALAKHVGAPTETYDELSNPVQQMVAQTSPIFPAYRSRICDSGRTAAACRCSVFQFTRWRNVRAIVSPPANAAREVRNACKRIVKADDRFSRDDRWHKRSSGYGINTHRRRPLNLKNRSRGRVHCRRLTIIDWPHGLGFALRSRMETTAAASTPRSSTRCGNSVFCRRNDLEILSLIHQPSLRIAAVIAWVK